MSEFQQVLDHIRSVSRTEAGKGRLFERLIKTFFEQDPIYSDRFSAVSLWSDWADGHTEFDRVDIGIDLVAEERDGGFCAVQCKCYAPNTRISKAHLDSFIAASSRTPFTARIVVDTGHEWGPNAIRTIEGLQPGCAVIRFGDLAERPFDWPDLAREEPEALAYRSETFNLRPHQQSALDDVTAGFATGDRGKLVMACGTGKTFTSLRIAEHLAGLGGRVLYLVPSISLFQQSMREWAEQRALAHHYVGICSDIRAGRDDEDATLHELEIPVTTNPQAITDALHSVPADAMTVVYCTYHSLPLIEQVQDDGAPPFDLILCDEAHRTTGVERPGDKTSPFVLVHDAARIRAIRRLYMTATPRLYTRSAKDKAASHDVEVFSMDNTATYGHEFHRLPFSRAVEQDLLSDYKVVVLTLSEEHVEAALQSHLATEEGSEINLTDAAKIIGCWQVLQNPENKDPNDGAIRPLQRAIAFTNTIKASKRLDAHWASIVEQAVAQLTDAEQDGAFRCATEHVDGQHHALQRKSRIEWLKGSTDDGCRILSNARCLSEGIDVPALDAVLFMSPRNSHVDIVQAVGRAMRKAVGKQYGYIVLPVAVPAGIDPASALDDNERFAPVWSVLRALRSHDDRFDAEINQIDLNKKRTRRIIFTGGDGGGGEQMPLPFPPLDLPPGAIYAKIVEKCGDRKYWETWAKDVAAIYSRLVTRVQGLLDNADNETLREWFAAFHEELKASINQSITTAGAVDMMAQHIITRPVFEAMFEDYDFADGNPVAKALDGLRRDFSEFGLENEVRDLEQFYESVRLRARGLDNADARQRVLMELYERFFATALEKDAERLGIVYTPVEIVDFILASADSVLQEQFGRSLSDEGVHVLDPFTGTGIFLVRLLQSGLIRERDLVRKYGSELHANELVLLAYYIAAIHIEEAYRGQAGGGHTPFGGIVLTDTFNLLTERGFPMMWLPDNSERAERQRKLPIQVIVGNPPWSAGQRSASDENPNVDYPELQARIAQTYAVRTGATNKNSLYDSYKMAIRWASDRIGKQGVVAFVTNGSWLDGNVDSGVRACLAEEFTGVYVVNLRGNARTSGERRRAEGDNVFDQGSRAPVAITLLVRNPVAEHQGCRILNRDIGNYQSRTDKLSLLRQWGDVAGIDDWQEIMPDQHHDWIGQRDAAFQAFYPVASKAAKAGKTDDAIFRLYSNGYKTGRDAYLYNLSRQACAENARKVVDNYMGVLQLREEHPTYSPEEAISRHSKNVRWDQGLLDNMRRKKPVVFSEDRVARTQYRPFVKQHCYIDYTLTQRKYQQDCIFPFDVGTTMARKGNLGTTLPEVSTHPANRVICVPGVGANKPFSVIVADHMPDLHFLEFGQCLPRWVYQSAGGMFDEIETALEPVDNITDTALSAFQSHYGDDGITKDSIFDYVYGVLHAPAYRERFANDLAKDLPRIPFAPDFYAFAEAGKALADLHLDYETCEEYPLVVEFTGKGHPAPERYRLGTSKMRLVNDNTVLRINDHVRLTGIPAAAHDYQVNGRTPLAWFIDRYHITKDKHSGIINDPNEWFDEPRDLVVAIQRIIHVSVQTSAIVAMLPDPFAIRAN